MTFQQAQQRYQQLKGQFQQGQISAEQFTAEVNKIRVRDGQGQTWSLGVETGSWYVYRDGSWLAGVPPAGDAGRTEKTGRSSCLLRGCLVLVVLAVLAAGCLGSIWALNRFTDLDLFRQVPGLEDLTDLDLPGSPGGADDFAYDYPTPGPLAPTRPAPAARELDLVPYSGAGFSAGFSYPEGWSLEEAEGQVTILDPDSATTLYVGEFAVESGTTAARISSEVRASLEEEAEPGTFREIESAPWTLPGGQDAYLNAWEWTDTQGYYQWAFDLEVIAGETNYYFFLIGEDPDLAYRGAELIELVGESFRQ